MTDRYIPQFQLETMKQKMQPGKVVVLYGPRRTGKTTLLNHLVESLERYLYVTGDDRPVHEYLSSGSVEKLKALVGDAEVLIIDEAQKIEDIGLNLKLLVDQMPHLSVIATGSSTFDLARSVGEPLMGRKKVLHLFPLSQMELGRNENPIQTAALLESRLIFGSYPEVVLLETDREKQAYLHALVEDYLFKDILSFEGVKKSKKIIDLLQLIAFQVGKEVSFSELGSRLGIDRKTVERYLDLLEQTFVLINIRGFSRNLRSEVTKTSRFYFYDVGLRNTLINNLNSLNQRQDIGELWENYLVMERLKKQHYHEIWSHNYFWRTYDQKEIDWVEDREGKLHGYEFKWKDKKVRPPKQWCEAYPEASFKVVNSENYLSFIT